MYKILCLNDYVEEELFVGEDGTMWEGTLEFISGLVNLEIVNCKVKYISNDEIDSAEMQESFEDLLYDKTVTKEQFKKEFEELYSSIYGYYL